MEKEGPLNEKQLHLQVLTSPEIKIRRKILDSIPTQGKNHGCQQHRTDKKPSKQSN